MGCKQSTPREEIDNLILLGNSRHVIKRYAKDCNVNGFFINGIMCKHIRVWSYINFNIESLESVETELKSWKLLLTMLKGKNLVILCFEDGKLLTKDMKQYSITMYKHIGFSNLVLVTDKSGVQSYETSIKHLSDNPFTVWVSGQNKNEDFIKYVLKN